MGIAAYNRGSEVISRELGETDLNGLFMRDLNALEKYPDAGTPPNGKLLIVPFGGGWSIGPADPGRFSYFYRSIRELVRRWKVEITGIAPSGFVAKKGGA